MAEVETEVEVRALRHTEGWAVSAIGTGVSTFVHPLGMKGDPPRDTDIADFAQLKRGRDAQLGCVIHLSAGGGS